jgi:hypothetical protein
MGSTKREMERIDGVRHIAKQIAVEAGAITICEMHDETSIDQMDDDTKNLAYAIATNKWKDGVFEGSKRSEVMDAIKYAIDDSCMSCPSCTKMFEDDDDD